MKKKRDWLSLSYGGHEIPLEDDGFDYVTSLKPKSDSFLGSSPNIFSTTELDPVNLFNRSMIVQVNKEEFVSNLSFFNNKNTMSKIYFQNQKSFYNQKNKNLSFSIVELNKRKRMFQRTNANIENHMNDMNQLTKLFQKNMKRKKRYFNELFNIDSKTLSFNAINKVIQVSNNRIIRLKKRITKHKLQQNAFNKVIPKIKETIEQKINSANEEIVELSNKIQTQKQELLNVNQIVLDYERKENHYKEIIKQKNYILTNSEQTDKSIEEKKDECEEQLKNTQEQINTVSNIRKTLTEKHKNVIRNHEESIKRIKEKHDKLVEERENVAKQYEECKAELNDTDEELTEQEKNIYDITKLIKYKEKMITLEQDFISLNEKDKINKNKNLDEENKLEYKYEQAKVNSHLAPFHEQIEQVNNAKEKVYYAAKVVKDEKQEAIEKIKEIKREMEARFCAQVAQIRPEIAGKIKSRTAELLEKELYNISVERKQYYYDRKAANKKMKKKIRTLKDQIKQHKINIMNKKNDLEELLFRQEFERFDLTEEERSSLYRMFWLIKSIRDEMPLWLNQYNNDHISLARAWAFHLDKISKLKPKN